MKHTISSWCLLTATCLSLAAPVQAEKALVLITSNHEDVRYLSSGALASFPSNLKIASDHEDKKLDGTVKDQIELSAFDLKRLMKAGIGHVLQNNPALGYSLDQVDVFGTFYAYDDLNQLKQAYPLEPTVGPAPALQVLTAGLGLDQHTTFYDRAKVKYKEASDLSACVFESRSDINCPTGFKYHKSSEIYGHYQHDPATYFHQMGYIDYAGSFVSSANLGQHSANIFAVKYNSANSGYAHLLSGKQIVMIGDYRYGDHFQQKADIFLPVEYDPAQPVEGVIFHIHGGGGTGGDKLNLNNITMKYALNEKYIGVSINYRVFAEAGFDGQLYDVAKIIKTVLTNLNAAQNPNAAQNFDTIKAMDVLVSGESSGGYLTAIIGTNPKFLGNDHFELIDVNLPLVPAVGTEVLTSYDKLKNYYVAHVDQDQYGQDTLGDAEYLLRKYVNERTEFHVFNDVHALHVLHPQVFNAPNLTDYTHFLNTQFSGEVVGEPFNQLANLLLSANAAGSEYSKRYAALTANLYAEPTALQRYPHLRNLLEADHNYLTYNTYSNSAHATWIDSLTGLYHFSDDSYDPVSVIESRLNSNEALPALPKQFIVTAIDDQVVLRSNVEDYVRSICNRAGSHITGAIKESAEYQTFNATPGSQIYQQNKICEIDGTNIYYFVSSKPSQPLIEKAIENSNKADSKALGKLVRPIEWHPLNGFYTQEYQVKSNTGVPTHSVGHEYADFGNYGHHLVLARSNLLFHENINSGYLQTALNDLLARKQNAGDPEFDIHAYDKVVIVKIDKDAANTQEVSQTTIAGKNMQLAKVYVNDLNTLNNQLYQPLLSALSEQVTASEPPTLSSTHGELVMSPDINDGHRATEIKWDSKNNSGCRLARNAGAWDGDPNVFSKANFPNPSEIIERHWEIIDKNASQGARGQKLGGGGGQTVWYKVFCANGVQSEPIAVVVRAKPSLYSTQGNTVVSADLNNGGIATEIVWNTANNPGCELVRNAGGWDDDKNLFSRRNIPAHKGVKQNYWEIIDEDSSDGPRNQKLGAGAQTVWYKVSCSDGIESEVLEVRVTDTPVLWSSKGNSIIAADPNNGGVATEILWYDANHLECKLLRNAGAWDGEPNQFSFDNNYWEAIDNDPSDILKSKNQKLGWGAQTVWYKVTCANGVESEVLQVVVQTDGTTNKPVLWSSQGSTVISVDPNNGGIATEIKWDNKGYSACQLVRNAGAWDGHPSLFSEHNIPNNNPIIQSYWEVIDTQLANGPRVKPQELGQGIQTLWYKVVCLGNIESDMLAVFVTAEPAIVIETRPTEPYITTGSGNDKIVLNDSRDYTVDVKDGNNYVETQNGKDKITAGIGDDTIYSGQRDDIISAGDGNNTIYAGAGKDTITTGAGKDIIYGDTGPDTITAGKGDDELYGGGANDEYIFHHGDGHDIILDAYIDDEGQIKWGRWGGSDDKIILKGIIMDQVVFHRDNQDLIIDYGSGSIRVQSHFLNNHVHRIETVVLDDGNVSHEAIKNMVQ